MLKKRIWLIFCSILFVPAFCEQNTVDAETFVIKKKKKKSSAKKAKEKICENFVEQISYSPSLRQNIAKIDEKLQQETRQYLENDKSRGFIVSVNKKNAAEKLAHTTDFLQKMEDFCSECEKYLKYLNGQG